MPGQTEVWNTVTEPQVHNRPPVTAENTVIELPEDPDAPTVVHRAVPPSPDQPAPQLTQQQPMQPAGTPATDLFEQLPGQPDDGSHVTQPAVLGWWAEQARGLKSGLGARFAGLRRATVGRMVERMPDAADELPATPSALATGVRRFLPKGRPARIAAQAAVLGVLLVGTVGYVSLDKSVTLTVDGKSRSLHTFAGSVGTLLQKEGLTVSSRDLVAPAVGTDLSDGDRVVVRYARKLEVTVDGKPATYWTTELTVDAALRALNIRADGARLTASRSQPIGRTGLTLSVFTPKTVTVVADGKKLPVTSTAATVADLLGEQGLSLRQFDRLSVAGTTPLSAGLVVTLTRIDHKRTTVTEKVAYGTTKKANSSMYKGDSKTVTAGKDGSRKAIYDLVITDGKVTTKTLVSATVTVPATNAVVEYGTREKPAPTGGGGSVGGDVASLNWPALARCESGGNPRAVNRAGPYYGLYQFSLSTWRSVGGSGLPIDNSSAEQTYRAQLLYKRSGAGQWPVCGRKLFT